MKTRHFLRDDDISPAEQRLVLAAAAQLSVKPTAVKRALSGSSIGLFFEKPSLRTRVSAETASVNLGAHPLQLRADDLQLHRGETAGDSARVLCGYLSLLMARVNRHSLLEEFAEPNTLSVVNGLSERFHPLQALADLLTMHQEWNGDIKGRKLVYLGDGNNVCHSLMLAGAMAGLHVVAACPHSYSPDEAVLTRAQELASASGGSVTVEADPQTAAENADALYADVWTSMGDEGQEAERCAVFAPYQLNQKLMKLAKPGAIALHCLPAHRDEEISTEVFEGKQSRVFPQAHNRLPTTAALFLFMLSPEVCEALASLTGGTKK